MYRLVDRAYRMSRPVVFGLTDPEWAHDTACSCIRFLDEDGWLAQQLSDLAWRLGGYAEHQRLLGQVVEGVYFPNPIGLAAGFDKTGELAHQLFLFGFGSVEVGTFTLASRQGNRRPRLERLSKERGLLNRMGWNNPGAQKATANLRGKVRTVPIGVNIGPTPDVESLELAIESLASVARMLWSQADYIVINPSCCNVRVVDFQDPMLLSDLMDRLRREMVREKPIFVKLRPDTPSGEIDRIGEACVSKRIGLILGNTVGTERGALSGPQLYEGISGRTEGLPDRISRSYQATDGQVPIIACGGIETAEQTYELVRRGASLVQIYTSWIYNGPFWSREMCEGLSRLCRRDGLENISALRGTYKGR